MRTCAVTSFHRSTLQYFSFINCQIDAQNYSGVTTNIFLCIFCAPNSLLPYPPWCVVPLFSSRQPNVMFASVKYNLPNRTIFCQNDREKEPPPYCRVSGALFCNTVEVQFSFCGNACWLMMTYKGRIWMDTRMIGSTTLISFKLFSLKLSITATWMVLRRHMFPHLWE